MPGRRHPVRDGATIGRDSDADIPLLDPQVSRLHARLRVGASGVAVEDMGSHNGTYVNDALVHGTVVLRQGDSVRMGETVWRFFSGASEAPRGDVPPPDPMPSGARRVATQDPAAALSFTQPLERPPPAPGAAARIALATIVSYSVVAATAVAVVMYLALR